MADCRLVRGGSETQSLQGLACRVGVSAESCGSSALHLQVVTIPPGGRARAHLHEGHETAIYGLRGTSTVLWGEALENRTIVGEGDFFYIPAGCPHLPFNPNAVGCRVVVARSDAREAESTRLLPRLEGLARFCPEPSG